MTTTISYKVVPDALREDFEHQSTGRRGRRELPIDSLPWFRKLLDGKTVFVPSEQPPTDDLPEGVSKSFQKRLYARFWTAYNRRLHAVWKDHRGEAGVVFWLDPEAKRPRKVA